MHSLTEMEEFMLSLASRYLYLTNRQFLLLGVSTSLRVIARKTHSLSTSPSSKRPFLGVLTYPPAAKVGRIENVFYLTERGAEVLHDIFPEAPEGSFDCVSAPNGFYRDYRHRWNTVTAHICISRMLEERYPHLSLVFWHRYFQKTGANHRKRPGKPLRALTRVDLDEEDHFLIPDVTFLIRQEGDTSRGLLCALEMSNGVDTKRVLRQITRHCHALSTGALARKYDLRIGHKVLFVFSEPGLMQAIRTRFSEIPKARSFTDHVLFANLEDLLRDAETCWRKALPDGARYSFLTGKRAPTSPHGGGSS